MRITWIVTKFLAVFSAGISLAAGGILLSWTSKGDVELGTTTEAMLGLIIIGLGLLSIGLGLFAGGALWVLADSSPTAKPKVRADD